MGKNLIRIIQHPSLIMHNQIKLLLVYMILADIQIGKDI
jgi:hypothetical protein